MYLSWVQAIVHESYQKLTEEDENADNDETLKWDFAVK